MVPAAANAAERSRRRSAGSRPPGVPPIPWREAPTSPRPCGKGAPWRRHGRDAADRRRSGGFEPRVEGERRSDERRASLLDGRDERSRGSREIAIDLDVPFGARGHGGFAERLLQRPIRRHRCAEEERDPHGAEPIRTDLQFAAAEVVKPVWSSDSGSLRLSYERQSRSVAL